MIRYRCLAFALSAVFLAACSSSQWSPETVETTNRFLDNAEKNGTPKPADDEVLRLAQLFADCPEYAQIPMRKDEQGTMPRLRTAVPPKYPLTAVYVNAKALVKVAFVISEDGTVVDARIFETSDARFSEAALESVRAWTFYPGSSNGKPAKFLFVAPIEFGGKSK